MLDEITALLFAVSVTFFFLQGEMKVAKMADKKLSHLSGFICPRARQNVKLELSKSKVSVQILQKLYLCLFLSLSLSLSLSFPPIPTVLKPLCTKHVVVIRLVIKKTKKLWRL